MTTYRLSLDGPAGNAMASTQMLRKGRIKRIEYPLGYKNPGNCEGSVNFQVGSQNSFQDVSGQTTNVYSEISLYGQAAGAMLQTMGSVDVDVPVQQGDLVYVNALSNDWTGNFNGAVLLTVVD